MVSYLALFRGDSVASAELVAVSTDPDLIAHVAAALLERRPHHPRDPALESLAAGRRRALELVRDEVT